MKVCFCLGLLALSFSSFAATAAQSLELTERLILSKDSTVLDGSLQFTGAHFMTEQRTAFESENYGYLGAHFNYKDRKGNFDWASELVFEGSVNQGEELYYGAPELFVRLTDDENQVQVSVGRQRRAWSQFDQRLGLGIWQPQLRWDYLNPIQQGLTGAFFDMDVEPLHVTLFASPVSLPDQGPQFRLKDGRFESPSRWFWQPQTRLRLGEESSNLFYELETPPVEELVMNSSLGGMMEVDPVGPLHVQLAYAFKPMNQFFIGIECTGCVDPVTSDGTAKIHPLVVNHHVLTAESSWIGTDDRWMFSWTVDRPVDPKIPKDWWAGTELRPVYIPGVVYERNLSLFSKPIVLGIDYFQEITGGSSLGGGELSHSVESSADRYSFDDLLSLSGSVKLYSTLKTMLTWSLRYSYSFEERGSWLNSRLSYRKAHLESFIAFDVLGSETDPLSSQAGLFSRYRSNDRVYGGFGFVF